MRRYRSVKTFVSSVRLAFRSVLLLLLLSHMFSSAARAATSDAFSTVDQIRCASSGETAGLPEKVRFKIVSTDELELIATYRGQTERSAIFSTRVDIATHPHVAVFPVGSGFGTTGEAKILLSKEALRLGEVSTLLLIHHTSGKSADYQCRMSPIL